MTASLVIKTADELIALDLEDRWRKRRAARQTDVSRHILRTFLDEGGPIPVERIIAAFHDEPSTMIHDALVALDDDDLIRVREGAVDIAYPFSAFPTAFIVRLANGDERYTCCAIDALGIAPMTGLNVEIRSRCHHCIVPLTFSVRPQGTGPEARGIMMWFGQRVDERSKVFDSL
jgi:alkylmercury lyase-like protein